LLNIHAQVHFLITDRCIKRDS